MKLIDQYKSDWQIKRDLNANHFVYFGEVSQTKDDLDLIRGCTNSLNHHDYHFSVGSYNEYDVRFVRRVRDTTAQYIVALSVVSDTPQFYIDQKDSKLKLTSRALQPLDLAGHAKEFLQSYTILAKPQDFIALETLFSPFVTRELSTHLWPYTVEYTESVLYIYAESPYRPNTLSHLLRSASWLANQLVAK